MLAFFLSRKKPTLYRCRFVAGRKCLSPQEGAGSCSTVTLRLRTKTESLGLSVAKAVVSIDPASWQ